MLQLSHRFPEPCHSWTSSLPFPPPPWLLMSCHLAWTSSFTITSVATVLGTRVPHQNASFNETILFAGVDWMSDHSRWRWWMLLDTVGIEVPQFLKKSLCRCGLCCLSFPSSLHSTMVLGPFSLLSLLLDEDSDIPAASPHLSCDLAIGCRIFSSSQLGVLCNHSSRSSASFFTLKVLSADFTIDQLFPPFLYISGIKAFHECAEKVCPGGVLLQ